MTQVNSIEFMDGSVYHVGDRVEFWATSGLHQGTIYKIDPDRRKELFVQPDDEKALGEGSFERYLLNPAAAERHGYPYFVRPRDYGMSGGEVRKLEGDLS